MTDSDQSKITRANATALTLAATSVVSTQRLFDEHYRSERARSEVTGHLFPPPQLQVKSFEFNLKLDIGTSRSRSAQLRIDALGLGVMARRNLTQETLSSMTLSIERVPILRQAPDGD